MKNGGNSEKSMFLRIPIPAYVINLPEWMVNKRHNRILICCPTEQTISSFLTASNNFFLYRFANMIIHSYELVDSDEEHV